MKILDYLKECEEMAYHNINCYNGKPQYKKQYKEEKTKLEIITYLIYLAKKYGTEEEF